jgi:hypothetical protein
MAITKGLDHFDLVWPSKYLKAGDLQGKEVRVVIDDIEPRAELKGVGGRTDNKPVLYLRTEKGRKLDKSLICNKTNGKRIMAMYGPELKDWIGKTITLRAEKEPKSDSGFAVRVKEQRAQRSEPAADLGDHNPDTGEVNPADAMPTWDGAVDEVGAV